MNEAGGSALEAIRFPCSKNTNATPAVIKITTMQILTPIRAFAAGLRLFSDVGFAVASPDSRARVAFVFVTDAMADAEEVGCAVAVLTTIDVGFIVYE